MYERSVIILERYVEELLGVNKSNNLKNNYYTYKDMVEEEKVYKDMVEEENDILQRFEESAKSLQESQKEGELLYKNNKALEEERFSLFYDFETKPETIDKKLNIIEAQTEKNIEESKELRKKYVEALSIFRERQSERNQCARKKKNIDRNHMHTVTKVRRLFEAIDIESVKKVKEFIGNDKTQIKENLLKIMLENGKNEKVPFDENVLSNAIEVRIDVANKEAQCYILIYDRLRKLLNEIENDNILIAKYEKALRDVTAKLNFLNSEKEYIVGFLDNERMTAMNGVKIHKKMMEEACTNFEVDINQIDNLYELIIREASNKSTKKAYRELYNSTYLRDIEEKEKGFEEEITNVRMRTGSVINSNYWRIESIKNIYNTFRAEVTENFGKDLSEYEEVVEDVEILIKNDYKNDYIENLYEDIEKSQDKEIESEVINEFEDEYDEEEKNENEEFDDFDFDEFDEDIEDDKDNLEIFDDEIEEMESEEFDDDELDFNIFDKDDYEQPLYEKSKEIQENKIPEKITKTGIKKRTLRIKRTNSFNNSNSSNNIINEKVEKEPDISKIIINTNTNTKEKKTNTNKIINETNKNKEKVKINKIEANKENVKKERGHRKKKKGYSNNTSNTEFNNYIKNALDEENSQAQGITELTPRLEKKKSSGFFNKLKKTNKIIKDNKAVKNT